MEGMLKNVRDPVPHFMLYVLREILDLFSGPCPFSGLNTIKIMLSGVVVDGSNQYFMLGQ